MRKTIVFILVVAYMAVLSLSASLPEKKPLQQGNKEEFQTAEGNLYGLGLYGGFPFLGGFGLGYGRFGGFGGPFGFYGR